MKRWLLLVLLIIAARAMAANNAAPEHNISKVLQKSDLEAALDPVDDYVGELAKIQPVWDAINSAGPEIIKQLEVIIHEHSGDYDFLYNAYALLNRLNKKFGGRDNRCRELLLENITSTKANGTDLRLLGKYGRAEDASLLVGVLQHHANFEMKCVAARSLAEIGDTNALIAMKKVFFDLPEMKDDFNLNRSTMVIHDQIVRLEQRLQRQNAIRGLTLGDVVPLVLGLAIMLLVILLITNIVRRRKGRLSR